MRLNHIIYKSSILININWSWAPIIPPTNNQRVCMYVWIISFIFHQHWSFINHQYWSISIGLYHQYYYQQIVNAYVHTLSFINHQYCWISIGLEHQYYHQQIINVYVHMFESYHLQILNIDQYQYKLVLSTNITTNK